MPIAETVAVVVTRNAPVRSSREPTSPATVARSMAPPAYTNACPVPRCSAATARWRAASSGAETRAAACCDRGASHPSMTTPSRTPSAPNPNPTTTKSTARPPARWSHAPAAALPCAAAGCAGHSTGQRLKDVHRGTYGRRPTPQDEPSAMLVRLVPAPNRSRVRLVTAVAPGPVTRLAAAQPEGCGRGASRADQREERRGIADADACIRQRHDLLRARGLLLRGVLRLLGSRSRRRERRTRGVADRDRIPGVATRVDVLDRDRAAIGRRGRHATVAGGRDVAPAFAAATTRAGQVVVAAAGVRDA